MGIMMKDSPLFPLYNFPPHRFVRGEGVYLYDDKGRQFLDFTSGIGVNALGHAHPLLVAALREQAEKLWHISNLFSHGIQEAVASLLVTHCFADHAFFCNSGTEAVEMGVKMARRYHQQRGDGHRQRIVCFDGAFHGRSMTAISASGALSGMLDGFAPALPGFDHVRLRDWEGLRRVVSQQTAAILLEPVQGEGGIHVMTDDDMSFVRELAHDAGALLFLDEVQCGMGRCGRLFHHQWSGVMPDIVATAKGLGGGFPVGACLATREVAQVMTRGSHGSTFGGNPLAMAVAKQLLEVVTRKSFLESVNRMGELFKQKLEDVARRYSHAINDVRGKGLMLGVEIADRRDDFIVALREQGILTVGARGNVIRLLPPLIVEESHISECIGAMERVCDTF